ncbi:hypothetical protein F511_10823 [Dorcoceras hygrometricum]|uniref:Uncharacterized protein n=1 Tax=Dorcoceras hygrometricum TaxID=472368 RepID=A0A2Z7C557_9LAMI|nr:hypothetical protein F511_10823 [Dorcoceras hygrometricum]
MVVVDGATTVMVSDETVTMVTTAASDGGAQAVEEEFEAPISAEVVLDADEQRSLEDIILEIPVDIPLPSSCMEITKIKMGQMIKIPGVSEKTWFLQSLPQIPAADKGKEVLVEKDPIQGNPAKEHYSLICADIDLLVSLRAKFIDEVAAFFSSFSLRKLSSFNFEEMYSKEDQVLSWGETESPQEAIRRKFYILLKYRTILVWKFLDAWRANFAPGQGSTAVDVQVIELLSELYLSLLEEMAKEARAFNLTWNKPCCSKIFEGSSGDRGAVIAKTNTTTRSLCWIRTMILVNGVWTVEPCADRWVKIPRKVVSTEIPRQRQYDDTLPTMSVFFKLLRKRWSDVCLEVVDFSAKMRLLPLGSVQFCSSAQLAAPVFRLADVRKEVDAIHAKVDIMASRLNDIQKYAEETKEAHSHQILEFHSQAQENHAVIHAQLSELVDYIHRGRADKKGEISGSRGPQQPAGTQITGSAVTPSFEQRVQMAQRRLVQTVINADAATRESEEAAERDRERRRKEARSLKRRRKD